jgi:hypothetical protein
VRGRDDVAVAYSSDRDDRPATTPPATLPE